MAEKFTGLHRPELICSCWASKKQLTECRWGKATTSGCGHTSVQRKRGHQCKMEIWSCGACVRRVMAPKVPGDKPVRWGIGKQMELQHQCRQDGLQHSVSMLRELQEGDHQLGLRLKHRQRTVCSRHMGGGGESNTGHSHILIADRWCSRQKQKSPFLLPLLRKLNILHPVQNKCLK